MDLKSQVQQNPVADKVSAVIAVIRPILIGLTLGLKREVADKIGGYDKVTLALLPRLWRPGDRDVGICFEYAVHDAMRRKDPAVQDRVNTALTRFCRINGTSMSSILFAVEKAGAEQFIDTAKELVTPESVVMSGTKGRPVKLHKHINGIAAAFRSRKLRDELPRSISGLWKADLFLGMVDTDRWVGTTVKINPRRLSGLGACASVSSQLTPLERIPRFSIRTRRTSLYAHFRMTVALCRCFTKDGSSSTHS